MNVSAAEIREIEWERIEPPIWWEAIQDFIVADGCCDNGLRAHMVMGHSAPGRIVRNALVVGLEDHPGARYSQKLSHLSAALS